MALMPVPAPASLGDTSGRRRRASFSGLERQPLPAIRPRRASFATSRGELPTRPIESSNSSVSGGGGGAPLPLRERRASLAGRAGAVRRAFQPNKVTSIQVEPRRDTATPPPLVAAASPRTRGSVAPSTAAPLPSMSRWHSWASFQEPKTNPFVNETPAYDAYTTSKYAIVACTLLPLRLAIALLALLLGFLISIVCVVGRRTIATAPFGAFRRNMSRLLSPVARLFCFAFGFWTIRMERVAMPPGIPSAQVPAPIYVCNHVSYVDVFVLTYLFGPSFIAKADASGLPFIGLFARALQCIFVDRTSKRSRKHVLELIKRRAVDPRYPPLLIFPEGTTSNGQALINFKAGAFAAGVPIQIITLQYGRKTYDPSAVGRNKTYFSVAHMCMQYANTVTVKVLPVYAPDEDEATTPHVFASRARDIMSRVLEVPLTEHTYEDAMLRLHDEYLGDNFEVSEMRRMFNLDSEALVALFAKFKDISDDKGSIGLQEFCTALGLGWPASPHAKGLFSIFDVAEAGELDFREFVFSLTLLSDVCPLAHKMRLAFRVYDADGDGLLSIDELEEHLQYAKEMGLPEIPFFRQDFEDRDKDGDGKLTFDEFSALIDDNQMLLQPALSIMRKSLHLEGSIEGSVYDSSRYGTAVTTLPRLVEEDQGAGTGMPEPEMEIVVDGDGV